MKKVFCFNNCACCVFRTSLVLVWFQCCPRYFSRKKGISGTFLSLSLFISRPRPQKSGFGLEKLFLGSLFSTSVTWTTLQSDEDKLVLRLGSTIIETKYYNYNQPIIFSLYPFALAILDNLAILVVLCSHFWSLLLF